MGGNPMPAASLPEQLSVAATVMVVVDDGATVHTALGDVQGNAREFEARARGAMGMPPTTCRKPRRVASFAASASSWGWEDAGVPCRDCRIVLSRN
jgi:hypothetical protein